jgi:hypothetical protein
MPVSIVREEGFAVILEDGSLYRTPEILGVRFEIYTDRADAWLVARSIQPPGHVRRIMLQVED